jgi:thioesterase domain-containing protein
LLAEFGPDRLRRHFEVFRANRRASAGYRPDPYGGRAVLIRAEESRNWSSSWKGLVRGDLTTYTLPGDHFALLRQPNVSKLAEIIARESGIGETSR